MGCIRSEAAQPVHGGLQPRKQTVPGLCEAAEFIPCFGLGQACGKVPNPEPVSLSGHRVDRRHRRVAEVALGVVTRETFLVAPHEEVLTYWGRKVSDYDRWLAGMRKLQARIAGG